MSNRVQYKGYDLVPLKGGAGWYCEVHCGGFLRLTPYAGSEKDAVAVGRVVVDAVTLKRDVVDPAGKQIPLRAGRQYPLLRVSQDSGGACFEVLDEANETRYLTQEDVS